MFSFRQMAGMMLAAKDRKRGGKQPPPPKLHDYVEEGGRESMHSLDCCGGGKYEASV